MPGRESGADSMSPRRIALQPLFRSTRGEIRRRGAGRLGNLTVERIAIAVALMKMRSSWRSRDSRADTVLRLRSGMGRVTEAKNANPGTCTTAHRPNRTATTSVVRTCTGDVHRRFLLGTRMVLSEDTATVSQLEEKRRFACVVGEREGRRRKRTTSVIPNMIRADMRISRKNPGQTPEFSQFSGDSDPNTGGSERRQQLYCSPLRDARAVVDRYPARPLKRPNVNTANTNSVIPT